jgi:acetolactate synthase-1/2/3 large subunit
LIERAAALLRTDEKALLFLGGKALRKRGLQAAARIKAATGCDVLSERLFAHMERGAGIPSVDRLPYFPEQAIDALSKYRLVVLAGVEEPVAFFGYKDSLVGCHPPAADASTARATCRSPGVLG